jgi:hypothetical protein|tara:strand:+ start:394 stop:1017 length:624 start_codon:yes stop_codon:yes gene_type:complete
MYKTKGITAMYDMAMQSEIREGVSWYSDAHIVALDISTEYDLPLIVVCGVIAAISPNNKWYKNKLDAENMCQVHASGGDPMTVKVSCYNKMKEKANAILELGKDADYDNVMALLNGRKIQCFFTCIYLHDTNQSIVCIDGHARNIVYRERLNLTDSKLTIGVKEYKYLTKCYIAATKVINKANGTNYLPYQIQAITWCAWRRLHGIK